MDELRVTPEDLTALKNELAEATKSIDAGFKAPEEVGSYPDKIMDTHGYTSREAVCSLLDVLDKNREDVHKKLTAVIVDLKAKLDLAKAIYQKTDESYADVLKQQVHISD